MSAFEKTALFDKYISSLSEKELQAYHIAKSHLGSSFSLEKSKGFIEWKIRHEINISSTSIS